MNDFSMHTDDMTLVVREGQEDFRISLGNANGLMKMSLTLNEMIILQENLNDMLEAYVHDNLS